MPPLLHPRSIFTTSLFSTTLALSFIIVGLPHILPCPADPNQYADGRMEGFDAQGRRMVRRLKTRPPLVEGDQEQPGDRDGRSVEAAAGKIQTVELGSALRSQEGGLATQDTAAAEEVARKKRECPVPKPGGVIGKWMGFSKEEQDERSKPPVRLKVISGGDKQEKSRGDESK